MGKTVGGAEILKGIDLAVEKGEVLALIGPTGSGKTTLLRLLNLLDLPTQGALLFDGIDVATLTEAKRLLIRRRMSMVFQKPLMFKRSVGENVAYGLKVRDCPKTRMAELVSGTLDDVGLAGYRDRLATTLSGGEIQRVALARSIVTGPDLLLLDEPTANLDPGAARAMEEIIIRLTKRKVTIIMATHDLFQAKRLAQRLALIMDGGLVQVGTADDLRDRPASQNVARFLSGEYWQPLLPNRAGKV